MLYHDILTVHTVTYSILGCFPNVLRYSTLLACTDLYAPFSQQMILLACMELESVRDRHFYTSTANSIGNYSLEIGKASTPSQQERYEVQRCSTAKDIWSTQNRESYVRNITSTPMLRNKAKKV